MKSDSPILQIDDKLCSNAYTCIRVCPVNAIEVRREKEHPLILSDRCIGCGLCFTSCPSGAIKYRDSIESTREIIKSGKKRIAIVAPSIASEFEDITDYRKFVAMIRALGFDMVHEGSFGVDIIAAAYRKLFEESSGKYFITANCPSVVKLIEKYYPSLVPNLAPIVSPMIAAAAIARDLHGDDCKVVFIGPCIDNKDESLLYKGRKIVDSVLTFLELRQLFNESGIQEKSVKMSDFDPPFGNWGALYPLPAGILQAAGIKRDLVSSEVITASGKEDVLEALSDFNSHIDTIQHHFNLFFCPGCLLGPGMLHHRERFRRRSLVRRYAQKRVDVLDRDEWEKNMKRWSKTDLARSFSVDDQRMPDPSEESIEDVLKIIGKTGSSNPANCGSCGYGSCRDFAKIVAQGLAIPEMCHTYNLRVKQDYIENLRLNNKRLADTRKALKDSEELARKEKEVAQNASDMMNSMLEKLPSGVVIVDQNLKVLHSNLSFITMLGDEAASIADIIPGLAGADVKTLLPFNVYNMFSYVLTENEAVISRDVPFGETMLNVSIFPIRQNKICGAIVRDLYSPEVQREEVISRMNDVIDKNLDMVQKIGFLLGEGASETEQMLNSIIESYRKRKDSGNQIK